jgi:DNA-binding transcriptional regulator LsrR (DeoR family)
MPWFDQIAEELDFLMPRTTGGRTASVSDDDDLCVRAAWLHYGLGLTQTEVAGRLGTTNVKAHRLIARANRLGIVHVSIDGAVSECFALEGQITARYGLDFCQVAPDLGEEGLPLTALGLAGSRYLRREFEAGDHAIIGFGHGRTMAACVNRLPRLAIANLRLVSLLGGLTRKYAATPFDVIHRLAERTGAEAYLLPVPMYANSPEDRLVLLKQRGVGPVFEMGIQSTLRIVGIGAMEPDSSTLSTGMVKKEETDEAKRAGGVGEILGHIFDLSGHLVETVLSARALSMPVEEIGSKKTVAIAGGPIKIEAIRGVLSSGLLSGLITDERTAAGLVAKDGRNPAPPSLAASRMG